MKNRKAIVVKNGNMGEDGGFEIAFDVKCSNDGGAKPCKHCHSIKRIEHKRMINDEKYYTKEFICPTVVQCENEGGYNGTWICLDCLLETVKTHKIK
jgi:hypothetical protein